MGAEQCCLSSRLIYSIPCRNGAYIVDAFKTIITGLKVVSDVQVEDLRLCKNFRFEPDVLVKHMFAGPRLETQLSA